MRNPFKPREPTPLEIAAHELIGAQVALLTAHDKQERADAEVTMFRTRITRLRATIRELTAEAEQSNGVQP